VSSQHLAEVQQHLLRLQRGVAQSLGEAK
jgi:hypothetical protein